jgi:hypothetical protein
MSTPGIKDRIGNVGNQVRSPKPKILNPKPKPLATLATRCVRMSMSKPQTPNPRPYIIMYTLTTFATPHLNPWQP